jgi:exopolysaccharide biosynthesis polyprenyl glycosylphosphotransferase
MARMLPILEGPPDPEVQVREGRYRRALALADALVAGLVLAAVILVAGGGFTPAILGAMVLMVLVNKICGLYERDELVLRKSTLDEAPAILQITGLFALIVWLLNAYLTPGVGLGRYHVLALWLGTALLLLGGRALARALVARAASVERCLVIGDRASIDAVRHKLATGRVKAEVVGGVELDGGHPRFDVGGFRDLVRAHRVHRVIVAPVSTDAADTLELIRMAKAVGTRVSVLPRLFEVVGSSVEFDDLDGMTMLGVRRFGLTHSSYVLKRAFDLLGSSFLLVLMGPVMATIALAIKLDSPGPVFFRQTRVGRGGQHFRMFKFRSMVPDAEGRKHELQSLNEAGGGLFKIAEDPRVTRVGRFIRRTSLDELPQLLNVWRGEMSLVGPRPLVVDEDARVEGLDRARLLLTPGMTGHWQILGSARIPLHEMVGIDYLYVANWSLWTDLKILLRTIPFVLSRRGL